MTIHHFGIHHFGTQFLFGILRYAYLIHYIGNSVTALTFLQISSKKVEKQEALTRVGVGKKFFKNKRRGC